MRLAYIFFFLSLFQLSFSQEEIIVSGARIVDVTNGDLSQPSDIHIQGERILKILPTGEQSLHGMIVIDAAGKYVIPGLYDMHVHVIFPGYSDRALDLMLANGVTGFRDTWGFLPIAQQIRMSMEAGRRPVQRFTVAGNLIDGKNPVWPGSNVATTPEEGRELVRQLMKDGAEFIKVYSKLKPDVFFAIAEESKAQGMEFMGHVPASVSAFDASDAGMRSMEHMYGLIEASSSMEDSIHAILSGLRADTSLGMSIISKILTSTKALALENQDEQRKASLIRTLKENDTWQVPTLVTTRNFSYLHDSTMFANDPRLRYIDAYTKSQWSPANNRFVKDLTPDEWEIEETYYQRKLELLAELKEAGVPVLAGTDPPNPFCMPGFSLHDELAIFVEECGFSPAEALRTATIDAAKFLGWEENVGFVARGKYADLVILAANPLENIRNTTTIEALIVNGEYLDRTALEALLKRWEDK